jgi:hypothetical protein
MLNAKVLAMWKQGKGVYGNLVIEVYVGQGL